MARSIISYDNISQEKILKNILEWVKTLPNYNEIKDNLNTSTMSVIYQLAAGTASWNFFYFQQCRAETYLSTAKQSVSVYNLARQFGYNIDRGFAPIISAKYLGNTTIGLKSGDIVGKFENYDIIYFGDSILVERNDTVKFVLGKFKSYENTIQNSQNAIIIESLTASVLNYIDNVNIRMSVNDKSINLTKNVEDFVVTGEVIDFSVSPKSTDIYIMDSQYKYGLYELTDGTPYKIEYIETNGYLGNIATKDIKMIDNWIPDEVLSNGANPESIDKLRQMSPLYYSTMRRAVTEKDYDYLSKAHSLVMDTKSDREKGTPGVWDITLKSTSITPNDIYVIGVDTGKTYTYLAKQGDNSTKVLEELAKAMTMAGYAIAEVVGNNKIRMTNADARLTLTPTVNSKFNAAQEVVHQINPPCCTLNIFYIKFNQTRDTPIQVMTKEEQLVYGKYLQSVKAAGTSIVLIPASRESKDIKIKVMLQDKTMEVNGVSIVEYYKSRVREVLNNYEMKLNTAFNYSQFLAEVTKITVEQGFNIYQPALAVVANQPVFNLEADPTKYYIFNNLEVEFE